MNPLMIVVGAVGAAGVMYLSDPEHGQRRRAQLRDQLVSAANRSQKQIKDAVQNVSNRAQGVIAEAKSGLDAETVSDETLIAQVRSTIGRVVTNVSAIEVVANQGKVKLYGPILESEVNALLAAVKSLPYVKEVENRLQTYQQAGHQPLLQGNLPQS